LGRQSKSLREENNKTKAKKQRKPKPPNQKGGFFIHQYVLHPDKEKMMKTQPSKESPIEFERHPEAFPETMMMPSGWNLSEMVVSQKQKTEMSRNSFNDFAFPEPRTIPTGWNF
jgi:hypothetical protein